MRLKIGILATASRWEPSVTNIAYRVPVSPVSTSMPDHDLRGVLLINVHLRHSLHRARLIYGLHHAVHLQRAPVFPLQNGLGMTGFDFYDLGYDFSCSKCFIYLC